MTHILDDGSVVVVTGGPIRSLDLKYTTTMIDSTTHLNFSPVSVRWSFCQSWGSCTCEGEYKQCTVILL